MLILTEKSVISTSGDGAFCYTLFIFILEKPLIHLKDFA